MDYNSTFGYVQYNNLDEMLKLFINGSEINYLEGDNGGIHMILIKKATGEIVDDVCFNFNDGQKQWEKMAK